MKMEDDINFATYDMRRASMTCALHLTPKAAIVQEYAKKHGITFIDAKVVVATADDIIGLPNINQ